jgi:hypothetical protein
LCSDCSRADVVEFCLSWIQLMVCWFICCIQPACLDILIHCSCSHFFVNFVVEMFFSKIIESEIMSARSSSIRPLNVWSWLK